MPKFALSFFVFLAATLYCMMPATFAQTFFGSASGSPANSSSGTSGSEGMSPSDFITLVTQLNQQITTNLNEKAAQYLQASGGPSVTPPTGGAAPAGTGGTGSGTGAPSSSAPSSSTPYTGWGTGSGSSSPPPSGGSSGSGSNWGVRY